jgi:hypothetical protein
MINRIQFIISMILVSIIVALNPSLALLNLGIGLILLGYELFKKSQDDQ